MSILFKRKKWDRQPTTPAAVLLASDGRRGFGSRAVARAAALAGSEPVAVLTIAKIYGSSFGLPAPGLMPTKAEMDERLGWIRDAISRLERKGVEADGQVAQTRRAVRTIAHVARTRSVQAVVIESAEQPRWRSIVEGDVAAGVARRLRRAGIEVEVLPATGPASTAPTDRAPTAKARKASASSEA
ncbi:MAG TPA: hypothetical protein VF351_05050 [Actinomycetota bacterium]